MSDAPERDRLEREILHGFPIAGAMGVSVERCDREQIVLRAPLGANLNAGGTFFGGSTGALAMLAGWACCHQIAERASRNATVVIQHADIRFVRPARGAISARCSVPPKEVCEHWLEALAHHHKGRLQLDVDVVCEGETVARFLGKYVGMVSGKG